jgi:hypothetical protein
MSKLTSLIKKLKAFFVKLFSNKKSVAVNNVVAKTNVSDPPDPPIGGGNATPESKSKVSDPPDTPVGN